MLLITIILCVLAFMKRKSNIKATKSCLTIALIISATEILYFYMASMAQNLTVKSELGLLALGWVVLMMVRLSIQDGTNKKSSALEFEEIDTRRKTHKERASLSDNSKNYKDDYWKIVSFVFQELKDTPIYRKWKQEQFNCQLGRCAICDKPMDKRYNQTDHVKPRYNFGTNYSDNLVVVHKKCNENKGVNTGYSKPNWLKHNKFDKELDEMVVKITNKVRGDFPEKLPDKYFSAPKSNK